MRFINFREFVTNVNIELKDVVRYLSEDLGNALRDLKTGLLKLRFDDNFETFTKELSIGFGEEVAIPNEFRTSIPSEYIITSSDEGGLYVCKGDAAWTENTIYLKNTSGSLIANIKIRFLK